MVAITPVSVPRSILKYEGITLFSYKIFEIPTAYQSWLSIVGPDTKPK